MGLLGEIFSAGDSAKRKLRGLLSDPIGELGLFGTRAAEDIQNMNQLAAMAYPMLPREQIRTDTPQGRERVVEQNRARNQLADLASNMGMAAATVWHGSPHKFDKFDSSKIGTGEGAQAYGHGLYLADSPHVAGNYQKQLTESKGAEGQAAYLLRMYKDNALDIARRQLEHPTLTPEARKYAEDVVSALERGNVNTGHLYKVDLPDEAISKMLDWDKPLSQQAPEVQKILNNRTALSAIRSAGVPVTPISFEGKKSLDIGASNGADLYRQIGDDASDVFRRLGIPGIRYLDGGSRGAGTGTRNYVVFPGNEGLLTILERNGMKP